MTVRYYRPRTKAALIRHLLEEHRVVAIAPSITLKKLTDYHDTEHKRRVVQEETPAMTTPMTIWTSRNTRPITIEELKVGDRIALDNGAKIGFVSEVITPAPKFGHYLFMVTLRGKSNRPIYRKFAPGRTVDLCVPTVKEN